MNSMTAIGRVTRDAEIRTVKVGGEDTKVTNFTVAVNDGFGDSQVTDFIRVSIWRNRAEKLTPYLKKGRLISVKGAVHLETYVDANQQAHTRMVIGRPEGIELLGKNPEAGDEDEEFPIPDEE